MKKLFISSYLLICVLPVFSQVDPQNSYGKLSSYSEITNYTLAPAGDNFLFVADELSLFNVSSFVPVTVNSTNYSVQNFTSAIISTSLDYKIFTLDIIPTAGKTYTSCGYILYDQGRKKVAFIAMYSSTLQLIGLKTYPGIERFNAIVQDNGILPINKKPRLYVCGRNELCNIKSEGVILGLEFDGSVVWKKVLEPNKKYDDYFEFNNLISSGLKDNFLYVVGSGISGKSAKKDVLISVLKRDGSELLTQMIGRPNTKSIEIIDKGFSIDITERGEIIIGGSTQEREYSSGQCSEDILIMKLKPDLSLLQLNFLWAKKYDLGGNTDEKIRSLCLTEKQIYFSGYTKGNVRNPNFSYDAFIFPTDFDGNGNEARIYGSDGDEFLYSCFVKKDNESVVSGGYTNRFNNKYPEIAAPYIVEFQNPLKEFCELSIIRVEPSNIDCKIIGMELSSKRNRTIIYETEPLETNIKQNKICIDF